MHIADVTLIGLLFLLLIDLLWGSEDNIGLENI